MTIEQIKNLRDQAQELKNMQDEFIIVENELADWKENLEGLETKYQTKVVDVKRRDL